MIDTSFVNFITLGRKSEQLKVLICNTSYRKIEEQLAAMLPRTQVVSCEPASVSQSLDGVDVVIPSFARLDSAVITRGSFGLIQQLGVGVDSVDIKAATLAGVWVANVPSGGSGNAESVAELAIVQMITLARRLDEARANVSKGVFFKPTGMSLLNKCVCLVGLGGIGKALAERLRPFGVHLIAVRQHPEHGAPQSLGIEKVYGAHQLHEALSQADFVVLALPENDSNRKLIDSAALSSMKRGSYLINVARGGIVDMDALVAALHNNHLGGAGLDAFEEEPMDPKHPIFQENVVATPHIGGNTDESVRGILAAVVENIKRYAAGQPPKNALNHLELPARGLAESK